MRDTEPFTTSRVQVLVLALPVLPAAHITLHWSPLGNLAPTWTNQVWACAVGFESANHTELSCLAIGQLESNSVPPNSVCEEKEVR